MGKTVGRMTMTWIISGTIAALKAITSLGVLGQFSFPLCLITLFVFLHPSPPARLGRNFFIFAQLSRTPNCQRSMTWWKQGAESLKSVALVHAHAQQDSRVALPLSTRSYHWNTTDFISIILSNVTTMMITRWQFVYKYRVMLRCQICVGFIPRVKITCIGYVFWRGSLVTCTCV